MSFEHRATTAKRRPLLAMLALPLIAFIAGIAAMAWFVSQWDGALRLLGVAQEAPSAPPAASAPPPRAVLPVPVPVTTAEGAQRLVIDPETTRRVAEVEERLAQIESQSRAATGNANRAEGLLLAFAARRALDRGVPLGYIEGLLRQRFGDTQRQAVATIITASRQPVTLEELREQLQEVGPDLTGAGPGQDWWGALKSELGSLVTVRKAGTPSTIPAERLQRAERRLDAGQVDVALAEVLRLPGRENASEWIAAARRYVAARRALDTIETAALLEPRLAPTPGDPAAANPLKAARPG